MIEQCHLEELKADAVKAGCYGLDVESTGLDKRKDRLICITFAVHEKTWLIPFSPLPKKVQIVEAQNWLNDNLFNNEDLTAIIHNGKFDVPILGNNGFKVRSKIIDPMIAEWLCSETGAAPPTADHGIFDLKSLVKKYFKEDRLTYEEVKDYLFLDPAKFEQYARDDARDHWRLWFDVEKPALEREGEKIEKLFYDMEMGILLVIMEMEASGLHINVPNMERLLKDGEKLVASLYRKISKIAGKEFNVDSPEQLSDILFGDLKIEPGEISKLKKSTPDHAIYSTGKESLKSIYKKHKIVPVVQEYRKATKMRNGFLRPFLRMAKESDDHRIYPEFKQTGTRIGRLSSENPNGQNMPRKGGVRDSIEATEGYVLVCGDLNQIEYRLLAHQSRDKNLIQAYLSGSDMHKMTMEAVGCDRTIAKNVNFGIVYGMSIGSLAAFVNVSYKRAKNIYEGVFERFPGIARYKSKVRTDVIKNRYVETIFGRRRRFVGVELDDYAHRQAFHFTISGSAADVIKIGMNKMHRSLMERRKTDERYLNVKMLAQVHDEIVLEAPEAVAEDVKDLLVFSMEDVGGGRILVPVKAEVGVGKIWTDAKV